MRSLTLASPRAVLAAILPASSVCAPTLFMGLGVIRAMFGLLPFGILLALAGCSANETPLNLVLVTVDALRASHLTPYGYSRDTSPFLRELAQESVMFEDAISQCGTTPQSLSSLMTGLYPYTDRILASNGKFLFLRRTNRTLARVLGEHGYRTHAITSHIQTAPVTGINLGFESFDGIELDEGKPGPERNAEEITRLAGEWLAKETLRDRPFFLWLHYVDPHYPYAVPGYEGYFAEEEPSEDGSTRYYVFAPKQSRRYPLSDGELLRLILNYDREIRFTDTWLKILFEEKLADFLDDSIVVVTADHGEALGDNGIITHSELYHSILRVPLLIRRPGGQGGGRAVKTPVMLVDLFPTVLDLLGLPLSSPVRGISLRPLLENERGGVGEDRIRLAEFPRGFKAIYHGRFKLISRPPKRELFDLAADPRETNDLSDSMQSYQQMLIAMSRMKRIGPKAEAPDPQPLPAVTPEMVERLKDLGYVND